MSRLLSERPSVRTRTTRFSCLIRLIVFFNAKSRASPVYVASANQRRSFTALDTETNTNVHLWELKDKANLQNCSCVTRGVIRIRQGSAAFVMNSLFKVGDAVNVASKCHSLLRLCSAVLDNAHPGVVTCKLE